jgi:hypothetical protein
MDSHGPSAEAVHEHSRAADTVTVPVPPAAGTALPPLTVTLHRVNEVGAVAVEAEDPQPAASTLNVIAAAIAKMVAEWERRISGPAVVLVHPAAGGNSRTLPGRRVRIAWGEPSISAGIRATRRRRTDALRKFSTG